MKKAWMVKKNRKECDNFILKSTKHEMYLQEMKKSTLSPFDDKRCYETSIESKPWVWRIFPTIYYIET